VKHNRVGAVAVLGDGDRCAEAAGSEVPVQAVASTVTTTRIATHRRIYLVNTGGFRGLRSSVRLMNGGWNWAAISLR
jgi:hypothetical protein